MLTWAIILLLVGIAILIAEFFIPSSGFLGILATLAIIGAIVLGFMHSFTAGTLVLLSAVVIVPVILLAAIKYWPETPMGRLILVKPPTHQDEVLPATDAYRKLPELIGHRGRAKTEMLPGGTVEIQGKRYDAVSEGMGIEAGETVIVVRIETQRLVVRPDDGPVESPTNPVGPTQSLEAEPQKEVKSSELDRPVSSPFDEPLI